MPPCVVADMMSSMKGFDNDAIRTAIKEVAAIAFGGTQVERFCSLKLLTCLLLLSGSVADETVSTTALSCNFHRVIQRPRLRLVTRYSCSFLLWSSTQIYKQKHKQTSTESLAGIDSPISMIDQHCLLWTLFCVKHSGGTPWFL